MLPLVHLDLECCLGDLVFGCLRLLLTCLAAVPVHRRSFDCVFVWFDDPSVLVSEFVYPEDVQGVWEMEAVPRPDPVVLRSRCRRRARALV